MADLIANASFEVAAASGEPGEAESWTWTSAQAGGAWAAFNALFPAFAAWERAREDFAADFAVPWAWEFADAAARAAAGPFASTDVGLFALQRDTDALWLLTVASPPLWIDLGLLRNNDAVANLAEWLTTVAVFDGASTLVQAATELWRVIDEFVFFYESLGAGVPYYGSPYRGPTWLIDPALVRIDDPTLGVAWPPGWNAVPALLGGHPAGRGWKGWADGPAGTADTPLALEVFAEYWGTDPFYPVAPWHGGAAAGGTLRGRALALPVVIPPNRATFAAWDQTSNDVAELAIVPGTYTTAAALAAAVQSAWAAAWPTLTMVEWAAWTDGDASGVQLTWSGIVGAVNLMLGIPEARASEDARGACGLDALGPGGATGSLRMPASRLISVPPGFDASAVFVLDPWSQLTFCTEYDLPMGGWFPVDFDMLAAAFDAGVPSAHYVDRFELAAWFGIAAVWVAQYTGGSLTPATWTGGTAGLESFETPATYWPDHLYVAP